MKIRPASFVLPLTAAFVVAASGLARAEYASGGSVSVDLVNPTNAANANVSLFDGALVFTATSDTDFDFLVYDATFSQLQQKLSVEIGTGAVSGAYLASVTFFNSSDPLNNLMLTNPLNSGSGALASGAVNIFDFTIGQFTEIGTYAGSYDTISLTFNFDTTGDTLQLDSIANPEPGTCALFGLGAAGLLGWTWRRRKARAVPSPAGASQV